MKNKIFIATSLDGYIADEDGGLEWLTQIPSPSGSDGGFSKFMESIDALVMGRNTFEKVLSFGIDWPYSKKVFVWSSVLKSIPSELKEKVEIVQGDVKEIIKQIHQKGFANLYIDGGKTIQSFLKEGLVHELTITQAPVILGKGIPLFDNVPKIKVVHRATQSFDNGMVQSHYQIKIT